MSLLMPLARADSGDSTVSNLTTVLICGGIALGVLIVAIIPVILAWSRRHRHSNGLAAIAVLWGLIALVSLSTTAMDEMKYSREHLMSIESGYYDPNDTSDAPALPLAIWAVLAVAYAGLLAWPLMVGTGSPAAQAREESKA
jgi:hypothetical protein